jgi:integrase
LIINFAVAAGYRSDGPNPAAWAGLKDLLASPTKSTTKKHHAALPYTDAPAFLSELRRLEGVGVRALEFLMITAARPGEVIGARWDEIDLDAKTWTIPAERMKAGKEHRVPLSPQALALLQSLPKERGNGHVFIGTRAKIGERTMQVTLARIRQGVTPHGFRSTFSDWAHERTSYSNHVIETCLAHAIGSDAAAIYSRSGGN